MAGFVVARVIPRRLLEGPASQNVGLKHSLLTEAVCSTPPSSHVCHALCAVHALMYNLYSLHDGNSSNQRVPAELGVLYVVVPTAH